MQKGSYLSAILKSPKTIFTVWDIAILWQSPNTNATIVRLNYYVKKGELIRIRRGIYATSSQYDKIELSTRIYTPSYVSFETVLAQEGLIFQFQSSIQIASYLTREICIAKQSYSYRKIKNSVLTNSIGIKNSEQISIATPERAFLDILYTNGNYHFDNLRSLNWENVFAILPIYENQRLVKIVNQLFKQSQI